MTHAREVKSSLRRKDDKRKRMREKKLQRKDEEKIRKEEELKRLKNLKKEEIMSRLAKIEKVSGTRVGDLHEFLSRDFDPKDFDSHMQEKFGSDYYSKKDKKFKQEQDLEDLQDFDLEQDAENIPLLKENLEQQKESLLDDLYALDYEDLIGDLPVRFKYRNVDANNYGIKAKEILVADDKDLNEFLSLKKLAPYRSAEKRKKDTKSWYKHGKSKVKEFKANLKKTKTKKSDSQVEIDSRLASYNL
jgi:protein KRI1